MLIADRPTTPVARAVRFDLNALCISIGWAPYRLRMASIVGPRSLSSEWASSISTSRTRDSSAGKSTLPPDARKDMVNCS